MKWKKVEIDSSDGRQKAIAPEIISASRSTDIPAFYADWFMRRLTDGYTCWINPFNRRPQYVSFMNVKAIVFWSKNPKPILQYLNEIEDRRISYYFQFTVNDYEDEHIEPNVPDIKERIDTFILLSEKLGKKCVIWRFDPLLLTEQLNIDRLLSKIEKVGDVLHKYTEKLVFSFADISNYAKVRRNLKKAHIEYREFTPETMQTVASEISKLVNGWGIQAATCGEKIDLEKYGIKHNKCVDDKLLARIAPENKELMSFLGHSKPSQENLFDLGTNSKKTLKDPGQRAECGCVMSKDIGQYDTCGHLCVYCYANTSSKVVEKNIRCIKLEGDSILCR